MSIDELRREVAGRVAELDAFAERRREDERLVKESIEHLRALADGLVRTEAQLAAQLEAYAQRRREQEAQVGGLLKDVRRLRADLKRTDALLAEFAAEQDDTAAADGWKPGPPAA